MKYEVRELGLGGILDQTITVTKNHFVQFFSIVAVSLLPVLIIQGFVQLTIMPAPPDEFTFEALQEYTAARDEAIQQHLPVIALSGLIAILMIPIANAALVHSVAGTYLGQPRSLAETMSAAFKSILSLYWTWVLVFVAIMGGFILCFIPGIIAAFWLSLATQVVVIEKVSGFAALKRSRFLMTGNVGRIFALGIVLGAISLGLQLAAGMIPQQHVAIVGGAVIQAVVTVLGSVAMVIFYFSARCRNEQFDLDLLAANLGDGQPEVQESNPFAQF